MAAAQLLNWKGLVAGAGVLTAPPPNLRVLYEECVILYTVCVCTCVEVSK